MPLDEMTLGELYELEKRVARDGIDPLTTEERIRLEPAIAHIRKVVPPQSKAIRKLFARTSEAAQAYKQLTADERHRYRHSNLTLAQVLRRRPYRLVGRPVARASRSRRRNVRTGSRRARAPGSCSRGDDPPHEVVVHAVAAS